MTSVRDAVGRAGWRAFWVPIDSFEGITTCYAAMAINTFHHILMSALGA